MFDFLPSTFTTSSFGRAFYFESSKNVFGTFETMLSFNLFIHLNKLDEFYFDSSKNVFGVC